MAEQKICKPTMPNQKASEPKMRFFLWLSVSCIVVFVFSFLWIVSSNQPADMLAAINQYIVMLCSLTIVVMGGFFFVAPIFTQDGKLQRLQILILTTSVIVIMQLAFVYASVAYRDIVYSFSTLDSATDLYHQMVDDGALAADAAHADDWLDDYSTLYLEIDVVSITDANGYIIDTSDASLLGEVVSKDTMKYYSLPITEGEVVLHISATARKELLLELLVSLLTVMVVSIFLTVELVMFALQFLENKLIAPSTQSPDEPPRCQALEYIRPLAFVFFFSSKITSSFIPLVAQDLGGELFGITGDMLSSIPQSSETLFTCFAIFLTSVLIEKRGWKLPFVGGLCLVAGGSLLSAFSFHIVVYILARSVVGLGYGFAWMTLRNLSLFGRNAEEKTMGFSLLNAGIYAGVNCGSVLGSVLAETLGYQLVFLLSAAFTVLCSLTILQMENAIYKRPVAEKPALTDGDALQKTHALPKHNALQKNRTRQKYSAKQLVIVSAFVLLMIAPTTIAGGFLSYYLPLYFTNIGYGVSDVGRAQLLYGITIIYLGPTLAKFVNVKKWTYLYSLLIAVTFIGFGLFGGIVGAMIAVLMLGIADSFGFVMQNNYFLNYKVLQPLGESVSLSMLSFIKKITEMLGPITFALFMSGTQTSTICLLGGLFFIGTMVYIVFFGSKAELLEG